MKSPKHIKLAVLASTFILLVFMLAACTLGAARDTESYDDVDVDISAKVMEIHALLAAGLNIAELEDAFGTMAEHIYNAYDGQRNVYRFNLMTTPDYVNPSTSDGVIDWHGLRDVLVQIIVQIQYETFSGYALHSVIYSPSEGRAYIINTRGGHTDVSDMMLDTYPYLFDFASVSSQE